MGGKGVVSQVPERAEGKAGQGLPGYFVTLEGPDGGGKSTQIRLLSRRLQEEGLGVVALREPGGTNLGERMRSLLLDPVLGEISPRAEVLLYAASRAQLVQEAVLPALRAGQVVLLERYVDSSLAYQGWGLGVSVEEVAAVNDFATGGLQPHLTILLDLDPAWARRYRLGSRLDRVEARSEAYHRRVREGFLELARNNSQRVKVVDASGSLSGVHRQVWEHIRLGLREAGFLPACGDGNGP